MSERLPYIQIKSPFGDSFEVEMAADRLTIGRFATQNDIALEPDPQRLITRVAHCSIERDRGAWWILDNNSINKTFIKGAGSVKVVDGKELIHDGDVIRILGRLSEEGEPEYWELTFFDPSKTRQAVHTPTKPSLVYDWIQAKLFLVEGAKRTEIKKVLPQEHKLIRYMDQRNRANDYVPVMCTYEELYAAVWDEEAVDRTEMELDRLVWKLRNKIESNAKEPQFLQTVRGLGYRLVTKPLKKGQRK